MGQSTWDTAAGLHAAAIWMLRALREEDVAMGLGTARASALSIIAFGGPIGMGKLAAIEQVRGPTMTRIVDRLERDKLVARERDPDDQRIIRVVATDKGRRVIEAGRDRRVARLAAAMEGLDAREREQLAVAAKIIERMPLT